MTAVATVETGPEAVTLNRQTIIARVKDSAGKLAANVKAGVALRWTLAEDLFELRGTFAQGKDEAAAFLATATTASKLDESVVKNLVRAIEVRDGLTEKTRAQVIAAGMPTDSVLPFAGLTAPQARKLVEKAEKAGTTNTKTIRKLKAEIVGTPQRNRQTAPEATAKFVVEIREAVEVLLKDHKVESLLAGIELRNSHPNGDLSAAVLFVAQNPTPTEVEVEIAK